MSDKIVHDVRFFGPSIKGQFQIELSPQEWIHNSSKLPPAIVADRIRELYPNIVVCRDGEPYRDGRSSLELSQPALPLSVQASGQGLQDWQEVDSGSGPWGYVDEKDVKAPDLIQDRSRLR